MMKARAGKYQTPDFTATRDDRINRLKCELRQHIRSLGDCAILSPEWMRMTDSLEQIAKVAMMENSVPITIPNVEDQKGRKSEGTLWDQERDEISVRTLLEEGKLNLCLRILNKFIKTQHGTDFPVQLEHIRKAFEFEEGQIQELCCTFEESCGLLLKLAFHHVETMQILDTPLLVEHCKAVIQHKSPDGNNDGDDVTIYQQPALVLHYLNILAGHLDEMDDERIMDILDEHDMLTVVVNHLNESAETHQSGEKIQMLQFLARLMQSEAFKCEPERFIKSDETKKLLLRLKSTMIDEFAKDIKVKKTIRPLLDNLRRWSKQFPNP